MRGAETLSTIDSFYTQPLAVTPIYGRGCFHIASVTKLPAKDDLGILAARVIIA